ncbi:DsbC family protein [Pseudomonas cichorii]|nr:DsbC family protein [Pseudomonas cichorii]
MVQLVRPYSAEIDGRAVVFQTRYDRVQIPCPIDILDTDLLTCISNAVMHYEQRRSWRTKVFAAATVLALTAAVTAALFTAPALLSSGLDDQPTSSSNAAPAVGSTSLMPNTKVLANTADVANIVGPVPAAIPRTSSQDTNDDWSLPQSTRTELPEKLQMAAQSKLFTVDYSSGHERTLYVFADPECPNCQRLEPALEAAAQGFNVIVFPVAVIGREKSIASITPVLCLPPEQRKAAWSDLFDAGHGVMDLGKPSAASTLAQPGDCDIAGKALGVNEVAYQTYRIPGTPWVIADDGRHVLQEVLKNPLKLQAFMGEAEVPYAAQ